MVKVDLTGASPFFREMGPDYAAVAAAHRTLTEGSGLGAEFTGWLSLPQSIAAGELKQILALAKRVRARSQALVVVGIGGSYLGARAAVDLLRPTRVPEDPDIIFVGNGLSPDAMMDILTRLGNKDFDLCVISKSGTTLEPALAFRMFKGLLVSKYGAAEAKKRITAVTDAQKGVLHGMAVSEGWETFVVPDNVGGRFSVLSAGTHGRGRHRCTDGHSLRHGGVPCLGPAFPGKSRMAVCRCPPASVPQRPEHRDSGIL